MQQTANGKIQTFCKNIGGKGIKKRGNKGSGNTASGKDSAASSKGTDKKVGEM